MTVAEIIAKRIRALCRERRITLSTLAEMSGLSTSSIDNIIHGRSKSPTMTTMMKIANTFNMTLAEFVDIPELNNYYQEDQDDLPEEDGDLLFR